MIEQTPMMRQYLEIKSRYPDTILFFRLGDFYEMFLDDAVKASKILDIALTSRNKSGDGKDVPLCGVPYHSASPYIAKLVASGEKVAVCEQVEDPKSAKGIVKRDVVKVITPGTVLDADCLTPFENNFLASIAPIEKKIGLAVLDISTGDFRITESDNWSGIVSELCAFNCSEIIMTEDLRVEKLPEAFSNLISEVMKSFVPQWVTDREYVSRLFSRQFNGATPSTLGFESLEAAAAAAAILLHYAHETQKGVIPHISVVKPYHSSEFMVLDESTRRNLEITATLSEGKRKGSLLWLMDRTGTAMGGRKLKHWLMQPLADVTGIEKRLDAVAELVENMTLRSGIRDALSGIQDIERSNARIGMASSGARDVVSLGRSLSLLPELVNAARVAKTELLFSTTASIDLLKDIVQLINEAVADDPPFSLREGGIIKDGYSKELDELRFISREGKGFIARIEAKERARTGISSLKVRYNRVFGYYIEVTKSNLSNIPEDYQRRQTLSNAERFITPELKEYEEKVLGAEEKICDLEYRLFQEIRETVAKHSEVISRNADLIAIVDLVVSMADLAVDMNYCRPVVDNGSVINICEGRHPVVEAINKGEQFVPNDLHLDIENEQIWIITGPNMAGKSTFMRQTALIVLMAQAGSFVPASSAHIGIADRIFTRVGASDNLARGESTFMTEMKETSNILRNATTRSLVILDEIGRGTSTFDGVSIAWSVAEFLHDNSKSSPRTLFATHYHELTELSVTRKRIRNYTVAVREWNDQIIFLRTIIPGGASHSYGIQVARLAGLPEAVIERAKEILANLEKGEYSEGGVPRLSKGKKESSLVADSSQLVLFEPEEELIKKRIKAININKLTPLEALNLLDELKRSL